MEPHRPYRFVCPDTGSGATVTVKRFVYLPVVRHRPGTAVELEACEVPKVLVPSRREGGRDEDPHNGKGVTTGRIWIFLSVTGGVSDPAGAR